MIVTILINSLWQGGVVVVLTALVLRVASQRSAATRYVSWLAALVALVAIPFIATATAGSVFSHSVGQSSSGGQFSSVAIRDVAHAARQWFALPAWLWSPAMVFSIAALWIFGAAVQLARLVSSQARIIRIRGNSVAVSSIDDIVVLESELISIPIATGILDPVIVVPNGLERRLGAADFLRILEHERAHVRRGDVLGNIVQRLVEALLFWNPFVHVAGRRLVHEREIACDDWVVERLGGAGEYAACLAALGSSITRTDVALMTPAAFVSRHSLAERIERLVDGVAGEPKVNAVAVGIVLTSLAAVAVGCVMFAPALAIASPASLSASSARPLTIAAICTHPNADAAVLAPAMPEIPPSAPKVYTASVEVLVTIAPNGKPVALKVYKSSGYGVLDKAVVDAAGRSSYSPKMVNCAPVEGTYLFNATVKSAP
jgi:TonB family protein